MHMRIERYRLARISCRNVKKLHFRLSSNIRNDANDEQQVQRNDDAVSSQVKTRVKDNVMKLQEERNAES